MHENNRKLGTTKEHVAADYLTQHGFHLLEMNYRCRTGEIDIVATQDGYLVFLEVKFRKNASYGFPQEAVDYKKRKKISSTALWYLKEHKIKDNVPIRFDVVAILGTDITLIKNAFDFTIGY